MDIVVVTKCSFELPRCKFVGELMVAAFQVKVDEVLNIPTQTVFPLSQGLSNRTPKL